uniref:EGF-like domain-containing protein n=1 Tax=Acrobeloides nanus TaxID=290746 RepID=A0A914EC11_9BILA
MDKNQLIANNDDMIICYHGGVLRVAHDANFYCECPKPFTGRQCEFDIRLNDQSDSFISKHIIDVIICIFFLLLLPTLILYCIRVLYLFLKRWGQSSKEVAITVLPQPMSETTLTPPHTMYRTISLPPDSLHKSPSFCIVHRTQSLNPRRTRKVKSKRQFVYYGVIDAPCTEEMPPSYAMATTKETV